MKMFRICQYVFNLIISLYGVFYFIKVQDIWEILITIFQIFTYF